MVQESDDENETTELNKPSSTSTSIQTQSSHHQFQCSLSSSQTSSSIKPICPSSSMTQVSIASSLISDPSSPMCKICHVSAKDNDPLISPCRCSGTMQYIHCGCLMVIIYFYLFYLIINHYPN